MRSIFSPPAWLLLSLATISSAGFGDSGLDTLDHAVQRSVSSGCLPARQRGGAAAYRRCVTSAAERAAERTPLAAALDFDERVVLDARCADSGSREDCARDELAAIEDGRKPYLAFLDADERQILMERCLDASNTDSVPAYRRCLGDTLDALETLPPADPSSLALAERAALARRCEGDTDDTIGYRRCLLETVGTATPDEASSSRPLADDVPPLDIAEADETEAAPEPESAPATEPARLIASEAEPDTGLAATGVLPATGETGISPQEEVATSPTDMVETVTPVGAAETPERTAVAASGNEREGEWERIAASLREHLRDARARLEATLATLDGTYQALLATALVLPFLLLVGRTALRGGKRRSPDTPEAAGLASPASSTGSSRLAERLAPSMRGRERPAADPLARDVRHDHHAGSGEEAEDEAYGTMGDGPSGPARILPRSAFGRWLLATSSSLRREHAIEFLVYWMAYGDDRYDARSRQALLERSAEDDHDAHERIKRHALERDTAAFADALRWLQGNTGAAERMQILDLLMALLVTDGAMTPVQNTLLRFVADAFGIPAETLDERHEFAFDTPMPPLPRPDLPSWWEGIDPALPVRWNARALTALDEREQYRVRLGLPIGKNVAERRVIEAFRRAARRCQPHRFDALGERERILVESRLAKYEEARDALLGGVTA